MIIWTERPAIIRKKEFWQHEYSHNNLRNELLVLLSFYMVNIQQERFKLSTRLTQKVSSHSQLLLYANKVFIHADCFVS